MRTLRILFLPVTAAALGALFLWLRPSAGPGTAAAAPAEPALRVEYRVAAGRREAGPEQIALTQGRRVEIVVLSDRADQLHLHGYELERELAAGAPGMLAFRADRAGRFELELHRAGITLAILEIQPR